MSSITSVTRAPRLSDEVARQLTAAIRSGEFAPGARLPSEKELAERFEVSRMVVREAMSRLKSDELIDTRQGLGAFVSAEPGRGLFRLEPDPAAVKDLHDIFQLRVAVEGAAAGLAAVRANRGELAAMRVCLRDMKTATAGGEDDIAADNRFHATIARASRNPYFDRFLTFLGANLHGAIAKARSNTAVRHPESVLMVQAEHEAVFAAIEQRDAPAAEAAMRRHLSAAMERLGLGPFIGARS
ncbi:MAG TPA: FadR/GntR family transcriptional regulator [Bradyrhizobium sp.]|jgi:GntR family transcriptional repressor for pyruvate dehydrogenase complex|nr:FadR/GntR family transcriptional regulator [Bradyrhizobium sp.]